MKVWIYDLEVFSNYFLGVFKNTKTKEVKRFELSVFKNEMSELREFLSTHPVLIGFNNLNYDAVILQLILDLDDVTAKDIYGRSNSIINDGFNIAPWELRTFNIDLMKIWHFDNIARRTSLKWLEYMMRLRQIRDLPMSHTSKITKQSQIDNIIKYCDYDIEATLAWFEKSKEKLKERQALVKETDESTLWNKSDTNLGEYMFLRDLAEMKGIRYYDLKKERTFRKRIVIKNILLDYIQFTEEPFKNLHNFFKSLTLTPKKGLIQLKGQIEHSLEFNGIQIDYGAGGVHGCISSGIYSSDEDYVITDIDVASFYPNLGIKNDWGPKHLGADFAKCNRKGFEIRKKFAKGTVENKREKLKINAAFGKTNSVYSAFYDPQYTAQVTINGQLLISMLAEWLKDFQLLQMNTDGLTIRHHRDSIEEVMKICRAWEQLTELELEYTTYKKMVIMDVNNYLAVYDSGKVKRKGLFVRYEDMVAAEEWHKNPSMNIVPIALNEYFVNGKNPRETILVEDNMYEFLIAVKKQKNFIHAIFKVNSDGHIDVTKNEDRVLRFYASTEGGDLMKIFNDFRMTSIAKEAFIKPLQFLRSEKAKLYPDLDREYYIKETNKIIKQIQPTCAKV